ncbi:serine/threonine-protein kinase [Paenibacillus paeoniae]|uniref:Serine/threonine protein kinase n=1 Tax=Paenibacillus paeoniae TaxID=2292705 RepID=A0A371P6U1_9BACL|nr:serine/threonine-protein kinase [Paenibacillus paeoniae]REK71615.1 serine/threonine protein kinase [Paenibacillus paeoniae]
MTFKFNPGYPTEYVEDYLDKKGFKVKRVLSFGGLCTVVLVENNNNILYPQELVVKLFYGYYTVYNNMSDLIGHNLYAYKFYKELDNFEYQYWRKKFEYEAITLKNIKSKYWVNVYDMYLDDELPMYLMDYYELDNLSTYINMVGSGQKRIMTIRESINIIYDLLCGLKVIHNRGIIHRDITPYNILINNGHAMWCDLGYARFPNIKEEPSIKEPFLYWPPEHDYLFHDVDERGDIYSIGAIFYRMLTATLPRHRAPSPLAMNPLVPKNLDDFIMKCLSYNPEERFMNVHECLEELQSISFSIGGEFF